MLTPNYDSPNPRLIQRFKVIPLKLFYYQTFLKLSVISIHDKTLKKCNQKKGHQAYLRVSGLLKWGYCYWLRVKNSNHFHAELSPNYLEDAKFILKAKLHSFIDISGTIAVFDCLAAGILHFFGQFLS